MRRILAQAEERAIVTINEADFRKLAERATSHHGVISIPSGGNAQEQFEFISAAVEFALRRSVVLPNFKDELVIVAPDMTVSTEVFCASPFSGLPVQLRDVIH